MIPLYLELKRPGGYPIFVNAEKIICMNRGRNGDVTYIAVGLNQPIGALETPEEIMQSIADLVCEDTVADVDTPGTALGGRVGWSGQPFIDLDEFAANLEASKTAQPPGDRPFKDHLLGDLVNVADVVPEKRNAVADEIIIRIREEKSLDSREGPQMLRKLYAALGEVIARGAQ